MQTTLPTQITTRQEAQKLLFDLHTNGEAFHPEDDANGLVNSYVLFTKEEGEKLNSLMNQIYELKGNDGRHTEPMIFDPCEYLLSIDEDYIKTFTEQ